MTVGYTENICKQGTLKRYYGAKIAPYSVFYFIMDNPYLKGFFFAQNKHTKAQLQDINQVIKGVKVC